MCFLWMTSCSEVPPIINPVSDEPTTGCARTITYEALIDQPKRVLIEEFTGVRCVNCPAGSEAIQDLIDIHGDRLVVISIHAGFFSNPYPDNLFDFRTEVGDQLINFIGNPVGYPSASIDRKVFDGEFDLQISRNAWPGYVDEQLGQSPAVFLHLENSYDDNSRSLSVEVTVFPVLGQPLPTGLRLTVLTTEKSVDDLQLTPNGLEADYTHYHVLRSALSNFEGNLIPDDLTAGMPWCVSFVTALNPGWNAEKMDVVALVSQSGETKTVLQVVEEGVVN